MTKLTLRVQGETQVIVRRRFAAPPDLIYRAHTDRALIPQWMTGPDGWTMSRCDQNADGTFRYDWTNGDGHSFYLTGEFIETDPPHRIVHVERMHLPDPTPDNRIETLFKADGDGTLMVMTMSLPDAATRAAMLETGMEHGMEDSYARLERTMP